MVKAQFKEQIFNRHLGIWDLFYLSNRLLQKSYAFPVRDHVVHLEINIRKTL